MAKRSSATADKWTSDQILEYWDDPRNRDHVVGAVPIDSLSTADVISDHFQDFNPEFVSRVLSAVPGDFMSNYTFYTQIIDEEHVAKLLKEKNVSRLRSYFANLVKEHPIPAKTTAEEET